MSVLETSVDAHKKDERNSKITSLLNAKDELEKKLKTFEDYLEKLKTQTVETPKFDIIKKGKNVIVGAQNFVPSNISLSNIIKKGGNIIERGILSSCHLAGNTIKTIEIGANICVKSVILLSRETAKTAKSALHTTKTTASTSKHWIVGKCKKTENDYLKDEKVLGIAVGKLEKKIEHYREKLYKIEKELKTVGSPQSTLINPQSADTVTPSMPPQHPVGAGSKPALNVPTTEPKPVGAGLAPALRKNFTRILPDAFSTPQTTGINEDTDEQKTYKTVEQASCLLNKIHKTDTILPVPDQPDVEMLKLKHIQQDILSEDTEIRKLAAEELGNIGATAIPTLSQLLNDDEDEEVKIAAVESFAKIGDESAIKILEQIFQDKNTRIKLSILRIICKINPGAPLLRKALTDSEPTVRRQSLVYAGWNRTNDYVKDILNILKTDEDENVRKEALTALLNIKDEQAIPYLILGLEDKSDIVRTAAIKSLRSIAEERNFNVDPVRFFAFDPASASSESERKKIVKLWQQWWQEMENDKQD